MQTITYYKVVYVDENGIVVDTDFQTEAQARTFAVNYTDSRIYRYKILGQSEDIT